VTDDCQKLFDINQSVITITTVYMRSLFTARQPKASHFAPGPPFAATVYDDKVKQRGVPGEYVGNVDYLLQHGAHVVIANATRHVAHYLKT